MPSVYYTRWAWIGALCIVFILFLMLTTSLLPECAFHRWRILTQHIFLLFFSALFWVLFKKNFPILILTISHCDNESYTHFSRWQSIKTVSKFEIISYMFFLIWHMLMLDILVALLIKSNFKLVLLRLRWGFK